MKETKIKTSQSWGCMFMFSHHTNYDLEQKLLEECIFSFL